MIDMISVDHHRSPSCIVFLICCCDRDYRGKWKTSTYLVASFVRRIPGWRDLAGVLNPISGEMVVLESFADCAFGVWPVGPV
jgi:hypothetical protein